MAWYRRPCVWYVRAIVPVRGREASFTVTADGGSRLTTAKKRETFKMRGDHMTGGSGLWSTESLTGYGRYRVTDLGPRGTSG
jgi:hypothetical protein